MRAFPRSAAPQAEPLPVDAAQLGCEGPRCPGKLETRSRPRGMRGRGPAVHRVQCPARQAGGRGLGGVGVPRK